MVVPVMDALTSFHARFGHAEQVVYGWGIFLLVGVALSLYHTFSFDA